MKLKILKEVFKNIPKGLAYSGIYGELAFKHPENVFYSSLSFPISLSLFEGAAYTNLLLGLTGSATSFIALPITMTIRILHTTYIREKCRLENKKGPAERGRSNKKIKN